jgi:hypothetical protein
MKILSLVTPKFHHNLTLYILFQSRLRFCFDLQQVGFKVVVRFKGENTNMWTIWTIILIIFLDVNELKM